MSWLWQWLGATLRGAWLWGVVRGRLAINILKESDRGARERQGHGQEREEEGPEVDQGEARGQEVEERVQLPLIPAQAAVSSASRVSPSLAKSTRTALPSTGRTSERPPCIQSRIASPNA